MRNIDDKIKELQQLKEAKVNAYKSVADFINSIEVDKRIKSDFETFKKLVINAIARRVTLPQEEV